MKSRVLLLVCFFIILAQTICAQEAKIIGRVNGSGLRVRENWNLEARILDQLPVDEIVEVLDTSPSRTQIGEMNTHWFKIRRGDLTGWVYGYFLDLFIEIQHEGNRLRFAPFLADSVDIRREPGFKDPYSGIYYPPHSVYTLTGYHPTEAPEKERCIYIYPLKTHEGNPPLSAKRIAVLEKLLDSPGTDISRDDVPVFPNVPAHQLFIAHAEKIENEFVQGIRFLTYFVQDGVWPVPGKILYIFQGFDADRTRWLSGWFLIERPDLPIDAEVSGDKLYDRYDLTRDFEKELTAAEEADFSPNLEYLDALMLSIR